MIAAPVVLLTATRNRGAFLETRFVPSVLGQERLPDHVVVVDDSNRGQGSGARAAVARLRRAGLEVTYLPPTSRHGLGAAWNRGLRAARALFPEAWIAGLDDDDWWEPVHLAACLRAAERTGADVLFARSTPVRDGARLTPFDRGKPTLVAFLRGNPGFQGSTMFFRLSVVLAVGGFDRTMPSTLDRDLAVRLLQRGEARWAVSGARTVRVDVSPTRARLSSPRSRAKQQGLRRFLAKHHQLMTEADRRAFWRRAEHLFGLSENDL